MRLSSFIASLISYFFQTQSSQWPDYSISKNRMPKIAAFRHLFASTLDESFFILNLFSGASAPVFKMESGLNAVISNITNSQKLKNCTENIGLER